MNFCRYFTIANKESTTPDAIPTTIVIDYDLDTDTLSAAHVSGPYPSSLDFFRAVALYAEEIREKTNNDLFAFVPESSKSRFVYDKLSHTFYREFEAKHGDPVHVHLFHETDDGKFYGAINKSSNMLFSLAAAMGTVEVSDSGTFAGVGTSEISKKISMRPSRDISTEPGWSEPGEPPKTITLIDSIDHYDIDV